MRVLLILILLAAGGYWWHYRHERFTQLDVLQSDQKSTERTIAERQKDVQRITEKLEPLRQKQRETQAPGGSPESLEKEIEELKEALSTAASQLDAAEAEFQAAVDAVRDHARKQTFPAIKLPSGEELVDCTISRFGEGYLSISHSLGISKVEGEDLPEGWADKYAVDYVSREAQAEKAELNARVAAATIPPLELKNAQVAELDARIAELNAQILAMSADIRAATRKADLLVRKAYQLALDKGQGGSGVVAKRSAMFRESKAIEQGREEIRKKYKALRDQKLALERQRMELKRKKISAAVP